MKRFEDIHTDELLEVGFEYIKTFMLIKWSLRRWWLV